MLSHRLYYALKPFVPWRLRMAVRRVAARRKRVRSAAVWPIDPATNRPPAGWPGWPDAKKFAFVITHDVEGPDGLAKVRQLAELEMKLGFRSSFNFIPEGPYQVPPDLRAWLTENGFEVGVHDLHHDGKLFASRRGFLTKAKRINHYLREWKASGYRSGFMLRNLDWLHELEITYDASTFDTDPFEPQPDGTGTIFPYWIAAPAAAGAEGQVAALCAEGQVSKGKGQGTDATESQEQAVKPSTPVTAGSDRPPSTVPPGSADPLGFGPLEFGISPDGQSAAPPAGYVELPYTLPQDSTLFLLLQERTPDIWLRKLDWVADHGGMALVNVHPDYINFGTGRLRNHEYPASHYAELLRHVTAGHAGRHWNPLPLDLALWFKQNCPLTDRRSAPPFPLPETATRKSPPPEKLRGRRAAVLLYSRYPSDPRPRRAAQAMIEAGMQVDLLCLVEEDSDLPEETVDGVRVFRVPLTHRRDSKWVYIWQYSRFFASSFWFLFTRGLRNRYDVVHVHNMPDFLVFAALIPKLRGARIILDLHDPMPELMESIYRLGTADWKVGFLRRVERWSIAFSNLALTPNLTFRNLFVSRSCRTEKMQIVMNSPQEELFDPDLFGPEPEAASATDEFRVMHHGSIVHRHGVDLLVEAIARLKPQIPTIHLDIYGAATPFLDTVLERAASLGIADIVHYHGPKSQAEIAAAIRTCQVGVVPNRRSTFTETNFPTRLFEYLAMHRPVIAPSTQGIRDYFSDEHMFYFEPDNVANLADRILWVKEHPNESAAIVQKGTEIYRHHLWSQEKARFLNLVAGLCPCS